jgi:hypothetical protein
LMMRCCIQHSFIRSFIHSFSASHSACGLQTEATERLSPPLLTHSLSHHTKDALDRTKKQTLDSTSRSRRVIASALEQKLIISYSDKTISSVSFHHQLVRWMHDRQRCIDRSSVSGHHAVSSQQSFDSSYHHRCHFLLVPCFPHHECSARRPLWSTGSTQFSHTGQHLSAHNAPSHLTLPHLPHRAASLHVSSRTVCPSTSPTHRSPCLPLLLSLLASSLP